MLNPKASKLRNLVIESCLIVAAMLGVSAIGSCAAADLTQLFKDAKSGSAQLRRDAVQMEAYTRSNLDWRSHAAQVETIKGHINQVGKTVSQLQAARADAGQRHQGAIDSVVASLQELASNTEAVIDHLNQSPNDLKNPTYKQYLKANADLAGALTQQLSDTVAYDDAESKLEKLKG